jgi:hypothetical protein
MRLRITAVILILMSVLACDNSLSKKERENYIIKGTEVAQNSFKEIKGQLKAQLKDGGPIQAIPFCNEQAIPITRSLSDKFNVTIKRTSDKLRNQQNAPSERELEIIQDYKNSLANNEQLIPIVELDYNNKKHFYSPILLKAECLICHGKLNESINSETAVIVNSLYPNDKATGYKEGDLRGIWSITFKN